MELKDYQKDALLQIKLYLESLSIEKEKFDRFKEMDNEYDSDYTKKAFKSISESSFTPKQNGLGEYLPNFCLKVPTGGGKTLLATCTVDLIQNHYTNKKTGFVLWIVPSNQIYRQTLSALTNREHPYRQKLDVSSGGRTMILEKFDHFTPQDVEENLCVMLLMLPSANRQNKETLKMFRDSSGFESFFPPEDQPTKHDDLFEQISNLDFFSGEDGFFGKQIKTSLGNTLRRLRPIVIIDEGQKTYSKSAQETIRGFNPSIVMELSATPPEESNVLVSVSGQDLNKEEMIKLDLHVINKSNTDWKKTLLSSYEMRNSLEETALEHQAKTGEYIRPISVIQVERTGKKQRGEGFIHSEDAKEYLIKECGVSPNEIAIKSSDKDDIEGIDLMSSECSIRYIITKQALQEGWDCPFAYVLSVLTNSSAVTSMTQLVGRILRQPYARKTNLQALDESYVYCFQQSSQKVLEGIRKGLMNEGMGDLSGRVVANEEVPETKSVEVRYREKFRHFEGKIYLPRFVIQEQGEWREISYEMDLVSRVNWNDINLNPIKTLKLSSITKKDEWLDLNLSKEEESLIKKTQGGERAAGLQIDYVFMTRHLLSIVPNPWVAHHLAESVINSLRKSYTEDTIASNLVYIVEELEKQVQSEKDRLTEAIFKSLVKKKVIHFFIEQTTGYQLPTRIKVKETKRRLTRDNADQMQLSLFEYEVEDGFNDMEKKVAIYMDKQEKLLWWYRNIAKANYYVQGWKKNKIYPDFIIAEKNEEKKGDYSKVHIVETKGLHLKGNNDTEYKQNVFSLCNELGSEISWNELGLEFDDKAIEFQVVYEDEWKRRFNEMFEKVSVH